MKRIDSHLCSIAYPILEQAGVLAHTRLKAPESAQEASDRGRRWNNKNKPTTA